MKSLQGTDHRSSEPANTVPLRWSDTHPTLSYTLQFTGNVSPVYNLYTKGTKGREQNYRTHCVAVKLGL